MNYNNFLKIIYCVYLIRMDKELFDCWFLYHSENYEDVKKISINLLKKSSFFDMVDIEIRAICNDGKSFILEDITFTKEDVLNEKNDTYN